MNHELLHFSFTNAKHHLFGLEVMKSSSKWNVSHLKGEGGALHKGVTKCLVTLIPKERHTKFLTTRDLSYFSRLSTRSLLRLQPNLGNVISP